MTDAQILNCYINIAPFLAKVCGPDCEVAIHDVSDPESSIVAIYNNVSGREQGNPMTDLALDILNRGTHSDSDYLVNYTGHTQNGSFLSSTYFIKNEGRLIGLLCINKDMTTVQELNSSLHVLLERFNLVAPKESQFSERLDTPIDGLLPTRIAEIISQSGVPTSRMSMREKVTIVHRLKENGVLMMRGAVAEIARQLRVSEPTIYRYIKLAGD